MVPCHFLKDIETQMLCLFLFVCFFFAPELHVRGLVLPGFSQ